MTGPSPLPLTSEAPVEEFDDVHQVCSGCGLFTDTKSRPGVPPPKRCEHCGELLHKLVTLRVREDVVKVSALEEA